MKDILLNHIFVKNRIAELRIKYWWLAEQIGVDRKTVTRWIQGQVRSVQTENLEKLSRILDCEIAQLTVQNVADQLATAEDQKTAAALLVQSSVLDKLGPIGEWNVIESLLKATIVPHLPLNILGEIYDQLCITSWRQSKIDQAAEYNLKAEEIAHRTQDKELLASALLSKANICSWRGRLESSLKYYRECLNLEKYVSNRKLASIYCNFGAVLYESGNLPEGEKNILKSVELLSENGKPMNLSISYCHLAMLYLQENKIDQSKIAAETSIRYAKLDDYKRGLNMGNLILAEIEARRGDELSSLSLMKDAMTGFSHLKIEEGLNYEFAGRVERFLGHTERAIQLLGRGIEISKEFPVYAAALQVEMARAQKLAGNSNWQEYVKKAMDLYQGCECRLRKEFGIQ